MRVIILGAGITGLMTAWALVRDGHEVDVVDERASTAMGASHANGGQLSYSYVTPLASPALLPKLPRLLLERDSALGFRLQWQPQFWRWCAAFLGACNLARMSETTRDLLSLSYFSRLVMEDIIHQEDMAFDYAPAGKLVTCPDTASLEEARQWVDFQKRFGSEQQILDREGCMNVEPALVHMRDRIQGAVFTPSDAVGDCHKLCLALASFITRHSPSSQIRLQTKVQDFLKKGDRIVGARTSHGALRGDAVVLALGSASRALAHKAGFNLPLYPLKGYSLTVPILSDNEAPHVSVTDSARKTVYARLGSRLRIAGIVDFDGYDPAIRQSRVDLLLRNAAEIFPQCADYASATAWAGLRSATPHGAPILGRSPVPGLFLNVGHGALGFTLAAGSAQVLSKIIQGQKPGIGINAFNPYKMGDK